VLGLTTAIIIIGMLIPYASIGHKIGMVELPGIYFGWLAATVLAYCVLTQVMKLVYIRRYGRWL